MKKIEAVIEIPAYSEYKYEIKDNKLYMDRVLNQYCPTNYGFVPDTLSEDNDPIDIFVISSVLRPLMTFTHIEVKLIGGYKCKDAGKEDNKLIAIIENIPLRSETTLIHEIKKYLETYKKGFEVIEFVGQKEAYKMYEKAKKRAKDLKNKADK